MEGQGAIGTLDWLGEDSTYGHLLAKLENDDGSWKVRDDVWVYYPRARGGLKKGALTVGYGANDEKIGPELLFGHVMGDCFESPVLLVKTAWGGKSLAVDFRPPRSGGEVIFYYFLPQRIAARKRIGCSSDLHVPHVFPVYRSIQGPLVSTDRAQLIRRQAAGAAVAAVTGFSDRAPGSMRGKGVEVKLIG